LVVLGGGAHCGGETGGSCSRDGGIGKGVKKVRRGT